MYEIKKINDKIYMLLFDTFHDVGEYLIRIQEFCESSDSRFRGKYFKYAEIVSWLAKEQESIISDYAAGYNIPGKLLREFIELFWFEHGEIREGEKQIINEFIGTKLDDICILAGTKEDDYIQQTLRHELAHGLFHTDPIYRADMIALVGDMGTRNRKKVEAYLAEHAYHKSVYVDETHAYMATGLHEPLSADPALRKAREPFKNLFRKYLKVCGFDKTLKALNSSE